jgi:hypothetical protein
VDCSVLGAGELKLGCSGCGSRLLEDCLELAGGAAIPPNPVPEAGLG